MLAANDSELSWAVFKFLSIISSQVMLLLAVAWAVVRRWPSK